jgi:hypothetical protein
MELSAKVNLRDLAEVREALDGFAIKVQDRIAKQALRQFAKAEGRLITVLRGSKYVNSSRHMAAQVRAWPSGIVWVGIGDRTIPGYTSMATAAATGRSKRKMYDAEGLGWRTHFIELGFHTWDPSWPKVGTGRGWKRGHRHRGRGIFHRGTRASEIAHQSMAPMILPYLVREIQFVYDRMSKGNRARRQTLSNFSAYSATA